MGTERGYGPPDVTMIRYGTIVDPDPNAVEGQQFGYVVGDYGSEEWETFSEGLNLLHNPWAETPLDLGMLRGITEHQMVDDGRVLTTFSRLDPVTSVTLIFHGPAAERKARDALAFLLNAESRAR